MHELMNNYRAQLVLEGWIRSFLYAVLAALCCVAVSAVVFWMVGFDMVWLLAVIFAGVAVITAPVLYFVMFRPTEKSVARRVDRELGLDERMVTMLEFRGSEDVIISAQRAEAVSALRGSKSKKISFVVASAALVVGLSAAFVIGAGTTTVSALSANGIIPSGAELLAGEEPAPRVYTITYRIEGTGQIMGLTADEDGVISQQVTEGTTAKSVLAVAGVDEKGEWCFVGWDDGISDPYRADANVETNKTLTAVFALVDSDDFEGESDASGKLPIPMGDGSGSGGGDDGKDGPPQEEGGGDKEDSKGQGGNSNPNNQIIDGETYYGDMYDDAYGAAQDDINGNAGMSDGNAGVIGDYMDYIKQ